VLEHPIVELHTVRVRYSSRIFDRLEGVQLKTMGGIRHSEIFEAGRETINEVKERWKLDSNHTLVVTSKRMVLHRVVGKDISTGT